MGFRQLIVVFFLVGLPVSVTAETLKGRIWYSSGTPVKGANVIITSCGVEQPVITNQNGNYRASVSGGNCQLTISTNNPFPVTISISKQTTIANMELKQVRNQWRLIRR